jgi:predicted secreted protein
MTATAGKSGMLCTLALEGGHLVAESQNFSLKLGQETIDLTNRDSNYWRQIIASKRSWTISGDGLYIYNDLALKILVAHWEVRSPSPIHVCFTFADGTKAATGHAILTDLTFPGPHEGSATISFTLEGTEALAISIS